MNIRSIRHSPKRAAAVVAVAGLLLVVGLGGGSGAESADGVAAQPRDVAAAPARTDVETLWSWLAALPADEREQVLVAFVPDVRGALQAIVAGMIAASVGH